MSSYHHCFWFCYFCGGFFIDVKNSLPPKFGKYFMEASRKELVKQFNYPPKINWPGVKPTGIKRSGVKPTGDNLTGSKRTGDKPTGDKLIAVKLNWCQTDLASYQTVVKSNGVKINWRQTVGVKPTCFIIKEYSLHLFLNL